MGDGDQDQLPFVAAHLHRHIYCPISWWAQFPISQELLTKRALYHCPRKYARPLAKFRITSNHSETILPTDYFFVKSDLRVLAYFLFHSLIAFPQISFISFISDPQPERVSLYHKVPQTLTLKIFDIPFESAIVHKRCRKSELGFSWNHFRYRANFNPISQQWCNKIS